MVIQILLEFTNISLENFMSELFRKTVINNYKMFLTII
jgi:hypothetical protein